MTGPAHESLAYAAGTSVDAFRSRLVSATPGELDRLALTFDRQVALAERAGRDERAEHWREVRRLARERRAQL